MAEASLQMKSLLISLLWLAITPLVKGGEMVEVFKCEKSEHKISSAAVAEELESKLITLSVYSIGERIKALKIKPELLSDIYEKAVKYDASEDPFYGKGNLYILKSKGKYFAVFFEIDDRSEFTNGKRFAIGELAPLGDKNSVFSGDIYKGSSFNRSLIDELKGLKKDQD